MRFRKAAQTEVYSDISDHLSIGLLRSELNSYLRSEKKGSTSYIEFLRMPGTGNEDLYKVLEDLGCARSYSQGIGYSAIRYGVFLRPTNICYVGPVGGLARVVLELDKAFGTLKQKVTGDQEIPIGPMTIRLLKKTIEDGELSFTEAAKQSSDYVSPIKKLEKAGLLFEKEDGLFAPTGAAHYIYSDEIKRRWEALQSWPYYTKDFVSKRSMKRI